MRKIVKLSGVFWAIGIIFLIFSQLPKVEAATKTVYLYGLHDPDGADRYSWMSTVSSMYSGSMAIASPTAKTTVRNYFTSTTLKNGLINADYLYIQTHGVEYSDSSAYTLKCIDSSGNTSYLSLATINSMLDNKLSGLRVAYIGACSSAASQHNFAKAIYKKGADCAIGYSKSVKTKCNSYVIGSFNAYFCTGSYTVSSALANAQRNCYSKYGTYGNTDSAKIYGSGLLKYN